MMDGVGEWREEFCGWGRLLLVLTEWEVRWLIAQVEVRGAGAVA